MTPEVMYLQSKFGIYDINSLKVIESINAIMHSDISKIPVKKSFILKNGKSPNEREMEFINKIVSGLKIPLNVYWFNWYCYCVQNLLLLGIEPKSTKFVRSTSEEIFGHKLENRHIYAIDREFRKRTFELKSDIIYGVNIWQIMTIKDSLIRNSINQSDKNIRTLFNKIYKRNPGDLEVKCIMDIDLTKPKEEMRDEIKSIVRVYGEEIVSFRINKNYRRKS